ncbi:riboflavin kinase [Physocladia obscura]|uniref:Riboflavin kinase n=1 Tax=Physocladia obscura TaxID=109957 RepID=A0AAD5TAN3_9FUNG|nr:riboflavin kinase [Physocladia obscura]
MAEPETQQRPLIVGNDSKVEEPYPVKLKGSVTKGFGRGGKDLGIPTGKAVIFIVETLNPTTTKTSANLPEDVSQYAGQFIETGILYGWASISDSSTVYPMVMSFGWNPFYKNEKRSAEVHIIHKFDHDFYGQELRVIVAGYIRAEKNYTSLDALIIDINFDIKVAHNSLLRKPYNDLQYDSFLQPK